MLFALICKDKPDHLDLRMTTRPSHVEFLNALNEQGILKMAGPFLNELGKPVGTLAVFEVGSREEMETLAAADPYAQAGLFESSEISAYSWVFNKPE